MNEDMSIYIIKDKINKYTTYEIWRHNIRYSYTSSQAFARAMAEN